MSGKLTTSEGFREAIEHFRTVLDSLSADQAAEMVDEIKGAAPKASKRIAADDLEDTLIAVEALKNRLRRKWKRQRRNNIIATAAGTAFAAAAAYLVKYPTSIPPWVAVSLTFMGVAFGLLALTSLASSTDWREDVARPIGDVADILAKALAETTEEAAPYRAQGSTRTRVAPTIASASDESADEEAPPERERKRQ